MGKQTSIFDVINERDDSIDEIIKKIKLEIKNYHYIRRCLKIQLDHENLSYIKLNKDSYMKVIESTNYWICLIGFCAELSKSNSDSKSLMSKWSKMNDVDFLNFYGEGMSYEEISEAIRRSQYRLRNLVMSKKYDNIEKIDDARRMLSLFLDSSEEIKDSLRIASLKKMSNDI